MKDAGLCSLFSEPEEEENKGSGKGKKSLKTYLFVITEANFFNVKLAAFWQKWSGHGPTSHTGSGGPFITVKAVLSLVKVNGDFLHI